MRLGNLVDPIADRLLDLRTVSRTAWLLRLVGVVAMVLALMGTMPTGIFASFLGGLASTIVLVVLVVQLFRPDTDIGVVGPLVVVLSLAGQGELSVLRALAVGVALLASHAAFALAATIPAHGEFDRSAWRLGLSGLLPALGLGLIAAVVVVALSGVQFGSWMVVVGAAAVIALLVMLLPRTR